MTSSVKQTVIKNPTWWKRRTGMERGLTLLSVVTVVISISLVIALGTVLYKNRNSTHESVGNAEALLGSGKPSPANSVEKDKKNYDDICLTPGCIHTASKVLEAMDPSIDPCDDFYQFACGSFIKKTNIPDDKSSVTSFSVISDTLLEQLRSMIEEPIQPKEAKPFRLTKLIYQSCMNKSKIESDGLKPIRELFDSIGGWPVLDGDNWKDEDFDWKQAVYNFRKVGYSVDYFIDFSVGIDLRNSTKRVIDLDQSSLGLRREFLIKGMEDKLVQAYYEYMVDIAVIFGGDRSRAEKELMESLEFEMKLANISLPSEKRRNASSLYNPMTVGQLIIKYPSIPWLKYLNTLLSLDFEIGTDEIVIVSVPQFISDFENLIAVTPKRTLANYLMWRAAASSASYLTEELKNRQLKYSTMLSGKTERAPRWKECIDVSAGSLSIAAGALYVKKYFNEDAKRNAIEMVADIRSEFKEIVKQVDWMDDVAKKGALEKVDLMATHIAYPDELLNTTKLEEFYEKLELEPNNYFKSILNMTLFGTHCSFNRLRQPVNKSEWITHGRPAVVNAFYSSIENSIQFPAGILQGVFFNNDRPKYMNYGAIGFVIGHEITHGFDDRGRQFDKNGNLVDWWEIETREAFVKKAQCIIDQYGNYTVPEIGLNLNGIITQGENIADNAGIKEAYLAYNKWVDKHGPEQKLPGLKYNSQQLFWISAANVWCAKSRNEELRQIVVTDEHSPDKYRVLGSFRNMEYFSKDFNCPEGSRMNPKSKCRVW